VLSSALLFARSLAAVCLLTLPLHASAIATTEAAVNETNPPFANQSCNQTSGGFSVGCNLTGNIDAAANSQASAGFGSLFVYAEAGEFCTCLDYVMGEATASFSEVVLAGPMTTTWAILVNTEGEIQGEGTGVTIMGHTYEVPDGGPTFLTITSAGGPISASIAAFASGVGPESTSITLDLVGFSSEVPEPGTLGITGIALLALPFIQRLRRR
jgi:hypothetical protein